MGDPKKARIVVLWDEKGLKVQSNGQTNPNVIAMLEMAKALILSQTIGKITSYGGPEEGTLVQAPALGRQVDRP